MSKLVAILAALAIFQLASACPENYHHHHEHHHGSVHHDSVHHGPIHHGPIHHGDVHHGSVVGIGAATLAQDLPVSNIVNPGVQIGLPPYIGSSSSYLPGVSSLGSSYIGNHCY